MITVIQKDAPHDKRAFDILLPVGSLILSLHDGINIYLPMIMLVAADTRAGEVVNRFHWRQTNEPAPEGAVYVASVRRGFTFLHLFRGVS